MTATGARKGSRTAPPRRDVLRSRRGGGRPSGQARSERSTRRARRSQWDSPVLSYYLLVGATGLLLVIGLVMVLSSSAVTDIAAGNSPYAGFLNQARFLLIGLPLLIVATRLSVAFYKRAAWFIFLAALAVQCLVFVPGLQIASGGNTNWIRIGPMTLQPSEALKLALAIWLGAVLGRKTSRLGQWRHALIPALPGALLAIGEVLAGGDLGTVLVFTLLIGGAFFVAGVDWRLLASVAAVGAGAILYFFVAGNSNRMSRITSTYGGGCDASSACYQSLHGLFGLGTGGFTGVGLGAGREKWSYLPEAHNDFIFSVIGEELGLLGTLFVLALFVVLGIAMSRIIRRHPDPFVKITTAAIACWIVGQAFINIGVVLAILPVIGVPLPLVSAGGSALVMTMAALGVVIAFARNEPGTQAALAARAGSARRSFAVVGRRLRRRAD